MKTLLFFLLFIIPLTAKEITPEQIQKIDAVVQEHAKKLHAGGVAVAVIIPDSTHAKGYRRATFRYGHAKGPESPAPQENSIFYLASVTKVLTATVLAQFAQEGKVNLDDPAQKYVPQDVRVPTSNGKQITLRDLATHTSGLPHEAGNVKRPYHYEESDFYQWLTHTKLKFTPGTRSVYSNVGFGFLGLILSHVAGKPYEQVVIDTVCSPLGMSDTRMFDSYSAEQKNHFCHFFNKRGKPIKAGCCVALPALGGGGAFASTLNDMSRFLAFNMGLLNTSLNDSLPLLQEKQFTQRKNHYACLGWYLNPLYPHRRILKYSKNGGMPGVTTYIAFVKETKTGVVVLSNCNKLSSVPLGNEILRILNPIY